MVALQTRGLIPLSRAVHVRNDVEDEPLLVIKSLAGPLWRTR